MDIKILALKFYDYSLYFKGYSKDTIRRYRFSIESYCKFSNISEIEQVSEESVRKLFYHGRTDRNWKPNTFICYHKSLLVFFRWCQNEDYLKDNPAEKIECPKLEKRIPPKLTKQEATRLLEIVYNYPYKYGYLRQRNYAIFSTFLLAGLRKKELINLKLTDVDIENMTIFVRQGKGARDRIIPMCYTLTDSLKKYLIERERLHKTAPEFFCSLNRNMGIKSIGLRRMVELFREESNIKFSLHKLRHTFATLMLEGGADIFSLSKMMGHSDIKTTTIYLAASAEHLRKQMTKHPLNNF